MLDTDALPLYAFLAIAIAYKPLKLKVRPNKKILEKEIVHPKQKTKLIVSTSTNRIKLFVDLIKSFISPSKIQFVQQNGFQKIDVKKC